MMKSMEATMMAGLVGVALSCTAGAQVTSIGEFTGDAIETFEAIGPANPYPGGIDIFGGQGAFDDNFTDPWITANLSDSDNTLFAYDGAFMGLAPTGWTLFTFDTPVVKFGGFFAHLSQGDPTGSVTFLDEQGGTIDAVGVTLLYNEWSWFGWESDTPIASITFNTGETPGVPTVYDNLQVTYVPAPGAVALLAIGACGARRRRRH